MKNGMIIILVCAIVLMACEEQKTTRPPTQQVATNTIEEPKSESATVKPLATQTETKEYKGYLEPRAEGIKFPALASEFLKNAALWFEEYYLDELEEYEGAPGLTKPLGCGVVNFVSGEIMEWFALSLNEGEILLIFSERIPFEYMVKIRKDYSAWNGLRIGFSSHAYSYGIPESQSWGVVEIGRVKAAPGQDGYAAIDNREEVSKIQEAIADHGITLKVLVYLH